MRGYRQHIKIRQQPPEEIKTAKYPSALLDFYVHLIFIVLKYNCYSNFIENNQSSLIPGPHSIQTVLAGVEEPTGSLLTYEGRTRAVGDLAT